MNFLFIALAVVFLLMGIGTLMVTAWSAICSTLHGWWDERATQGTIILTTMGVFMVIFSSSILFL